MFITCIVVGLLAVLSILPGLYYREYYLHEKKKTKHIQVLLTQKKSFIGMTICQLAVGGCMIALVIWHKLAWDIALREQLVLHLLAVIASIDLSVKKIPNMLTACLFMVWVFFTAVDVIQSKELATVGTLLVRSGLGLLVGGGIMLICMLISRGGLGAGDVKLFAVLGMLYGMLGVMAVLFYTCLIAAVICVVLLISKKMRLRDTIPMSPFIFAAAVLYDIFS